MSKELSDFERGYTARTNTFGFVFLALHVPVLCMLALALGQGAVLPLGLGALLLLGPGAVLFNDRASGLGSVVLAIASMGFSALTIHISGGMIEAHFHIFTVLALLTVFGRVAPVLAAALTIALHHLLFWLWVPGSVFNYQASLGIVLLHAFFVVFETVPACWIARQFGLTIRARGIVEEKLSVMSRQVSKSAVQVGKTSSDLSSRASEQAAALEETTASTLELRKRANENAQMATSASQLLAEIDGEALKARTCLSEVTTGMVELREASRRIEKVIQIVDDIAFQTNILALNAAVEAARAGEAGLGFAVVAAEVRNLSHRSATAASETKGLIETTIALSSKSEGLVAGLSGLLTRVTDSAGKAKRQANAIHSASLRQDEDTRQIGEALRQLEEVSQAAASNAELCSSTSSDLTEQAEDLNLVVSQLEALH